MQIEVKSFGQLAGQPYEEIFISNRAGTTISFANLGARINQWLVKDRTGQLQPVILGFQDAEQAFLGRGYYYGAMIGRVAGRIGHGQFELGGQAYQLPLNDGDHHLHGGNHEFDLQAWDYTIEEGEDEVTLVFTLVSAAETNGYPGELKVEVRHRFDEAGCWTMQIQGQTDAPTLFNPTNHVYFNLNGRADQPILNHRIQVAAPAFVPVKADVTPIGEICSVAGTAFDLRKPQDFASIFAQADEQLTQVKGFDHPFILEEVSPQVEVHSPATGLGLTMKTTLPSVVIYSHQYVSDPMAIWGYELVPYAAFTLETQFLPDAINQANFGNIVLEPGELYQSETIYCIKLDETNDIKEGE